MPPRTTSLRPVTLISPWWHAAESAMREVVGRKTMDSVLFESKQEIAESVKTGMQSMLDRYNTGIEVMSVAIQNAQPPEQVQAAFNDAVKARPGP